LRVNRTMALEYRQRGKACMHYTGRFASFPFSELDYDFPTSLVSQQSNGNHIALTTADSSQEGRGVLATAPSPHKTARV